MSATTDKNVCCRQRARYESSGVVVCADRVSRSLTLLRSAVVLCLSAIVAPSAFPSGTAIPTFGSPIPGIGFTITRQIVSTENIDGRLVGRPSSGSLAAITIYAPGCNASDIIIDEKATEGNGAFVQVIAPSCLRERFVSAAVFPRRGSIRVRLEKPGDGGWIECPLQSILLPTSNPADHPATSALGVTLDNLNLIQLLDEHATEAAPAGLRLSWTADLQTRNVRAAWHLLWPAFILGVFVFLSWGAHKVASAADRG